MSITAPVITAAIFGILFVIGIYVSSHPERTTAQVIAIWCTIALLTPVLAITATGTWPSAISLITSFTPFLFTSL